MLEIETIAVEVRDDHVVLLVQKTPLSDGEPPEWRQVARLYGRGSVRVDAFKSWRDGKPVEL